MQGTDEQVASQQPAETRACSSPAWMIGASPAATFDGGLGPLQQPRRAADCTNRPVRPGLFARIWLIIHSLNSIFLLHQTSQQYFQPWLISQFSRNEQAVGCSLPAARRRFHASGGTTMAPWLGLWQRETPTARPLPSSVVSKRRC